MRKFVLFFLLLSSFVFSATIDSSQKNSINDTLKLLYDKDSTVVNKLLTSSDAVYGEYTSSNYKYIYKLKVGGGDRIGVFIITEIYNKDYHIIKQLKMKEGFIILINGKANSKVIYKGYTQDLYDYGYGGAEVCESSIDFDIIEEEEHKFNQSISGNIKYYKVNIKNAGKFVVMTYDNNNIDTQLLYADCSRHGDSKSSLIGTNIKRLRRYVDIGNYYIKVINNVPTRTQNFSIETVVLKDEILKEDKHPNTCYYAKSIQKGTYRGEINGQYDRDVFKVTTNKASKIDISIDNPNVAFSVYSMQESENICGGLYSFLSQNDSLEFYEGRDVYIEVLSKKSRDYETHEYTLTVNTNNITPPINIVPSNVIVNEKGWLEPAPKWIFSEKKSNFALIQSTPSHFNHDGDDFFFEDWDKYGLGFQEARILSPYSGIVIYTRVTMVHDNVNCSSKKDVYGTDYCYGNQVIIDHGNGIYSRFAHLTKDILVTKGQKIEVGDAIGYMGNSGNTYGNDAQGQHLHVGFYKNVIADDVKKRLQKGKYAGGDPFAPSRAIKNSKKPKQSQYAVKFNFGD